MKKQNIPLQVAFWGNAVLLIIAIFSGVVTLLQMCPFILFMGFTGSMLWRDKNYKVAAIIVAGLMALLNLVLESGIDVLIWIVNLILILV